MSFWSGQTLTRRVRDEGLIIPFDPNNVKCSAYELHVGNEAFVTRDKDDHSGERAQGRTPGYIVSTTPDNFTVSIPAGQFAFLISKEHVAIPNDAIGFISIKTWKKFHGLVNVSGFHVDPGWAGKLIFAVFNAGPLPIVIRREEPLFLIFFSSLDQRSEEQYLYQGKSAFHAIPSELMGSMSAPVPTLYKLNDTVKELEKTVKLADARSTHALYVAFGVAALTLTVTASILIRVLFPDLGLKTSVSLPVVERPYAGASSGNNPQGPEAKSTERSASPATVPPRTQAAPTHPKPETGQRPSNSTTERSNTPPK